MEALKGRADPPNQDPGPQRNAGNKFRVARDAEELTDRAAAQEHGGSDARFDPAMTGP
jgi:hypothetical protein